IDAVVHSIGATGVIAGSLVLVHNTPGTDLAAAAGLANTSTPTIQVTSAGFDMTVANLIVGVSVNPGASGVWTHQLVLAQMEGI
ncbi:MAG: hypothetical protein ACREI9_15415, partial [Nitrospiraceae bacterium]